MPRCISGPNFDILILAPEFSRGQTQTGIIFDFQVKFDLEDHGHSTPKLIGILTNVVCILLSKLGGSSLNRWWSFRADKLGVDEYTHAHTDTQIHGAETQPATIPEGQNWPRVKSVFQNQTQK